MNLVHVVKVVGASDGVTKTPHDGRYVVAWNPHVEAGTLAVDSTDDIAQAKRFDVSAALDEWRSVSKVQKTRPWDGRPNRPLTALTIVLEAHWGCRSSDRE
jgi:hypothetical protein